MTKPDKEHNPDQKQHTEDLFFKEASEFFGEEALAVFHIPGKMKLVSHSDTKQSTQKILHVALR